jgi:hypothetical protein
VKIIKALVLGVVLAAAGTTYAQSSDAILDLLIKKGVINQREANDVREQLDQQTQQAIEMYSKTKSGSWLDALVFTGDLRLRAEYFEFERNPATDLKLQSDRLRYRYRLRFGAEADYHDWAAVNLRLGSGEDNPQGSKGTGDPVSNNTTFTDTWRKKPIYIDAAYVTLHWPGSDLVKVIGGKMDLPIWQPKFNSPLVYDFDNTPEGVAEQVQYKFGDKEQLRVFGNFGEFALKEFSKDANDSYMFDMQGGIEGKIGDPKAPTLRWTAAGGYYFTRGLDNFNYPIGIDGANLGNATKNVVSGGKTNLVLFNDFNDLDARGEVAWRITDKPVLGTPALFTVSGEYLVNIQNTWDKLTGSAGGAVSNVNQTTGWTVQAQFGEAKKKGQWQVAYQYKYLQADSTWDAITDSDYGNGGTDRKGHVIKAAYNLQDWWQLGFSAFITEKISDRPNSGHDTVGFAGAEHLRIQADTIFKF